MCIAVHQPKEENIATTFEDLFILPPFLPCEVNTVSNLLPSITGVCLYLFTYVLQSRLVYFFSVFNFM